MKRLILILALPLIFTACSNVKKNLGMERSQPDEFAVTEGAPLTLPPNFNLLPPQPGAPRPQETKTSATAQNLILGTDAPNTTSALPVDNTPVKTDIPPSPAIAASQLDHTADADLLSDAKTAAAKPATTSGTAKDSDVLRPTDESKRLQQQNINTTTSPVMKNAQ